MKGVEGKFIPPSCYMLYWVETCFCVFTTFWDGDNVVPYPQCHSASKVKSFIEEVDYWVGWFVIEGAGVDPKGLESTNDWWLFQRSR